MKTQPTPTQASRRAEARANGDRIRGWLTTRRKVADAQPAAVPATETRRRPFERLRGRFGRRPTPQDVDATAVPTVSEEWLVTNPGPNHATRRARARSLGYRTSPATNVPYRNPERAERLRRSGRLRQDLP